MQVSYFETGRYHAPSNLPRQWPMPPGAYDREAGLRAFRGMVERGRYAGLTDHPGHALARAQMQEFGSVVTFDLRGGSEAGRRFAEALRLFAMTAIWNVPGPSRPGYVQRLGRAMLFLLLRGAAPRLLTAAQVDDLLRTFG